MHQLVSDIKNLKSKHKDEKVQFEVMLAKLLTKLKKRFWSLTVVNVKLLSNPQTNLTIMFKGIIQKEQIICS